MRIQNILMYFALVGLFSTSSVLFFACLGRDFALVTENLRRKVGKFGFAVFVSFKGMVVQEIPDESQAGNHGGYYDDQTKGGSWSHTAFNGAGKWCEVDENGQYGTDRAGTSREYEQPWIDGYNEWSIPMAYGWGRVSAAIILPDPPTTQRFEIDAKGTFSIKKFGHNARRNRWGLVWLDGKMTL